jgi:hypothetical protein
MTDLVVTVPKGMWREWIAEGDPAGAPESGTEWAFFVGYNRPPIEPGERLYIVAWGRLRGYAPVTRIGRMESGAYGICRRGGAVAITIPEYIAGFRGWREPWWDRAVERPFPDWRNAGVADIGARRPG